MRAGIILATLVYSTIPSVAATVCTDQAATSLDLIDGRWVVAEMPVQEWEIRKLRPDEEFASPCFFKLEFAGRSLLPTDRNDGWSNACYTLSANGTTWIEANTCRERWVDGEIVQVTCEGNIMGYGFQPNGEFYSNSTGAVAQPYRKPGEPPLTKPHMSVGFCSTTP